MPCPETYGRMFGDRGIVGRAAKARKGIKEFLSVCLWSIVLESGIPQQPRPVFPQVAAITPIWIGNIAL